MSNIRASLKRIHSPDVYSVDDFSPALRDNFCLLIQAMFGPEGSDGEESFDITLCTPKWLEGHLQNSQVMSGRHYLIVREYNIVAIRDFLLSYGRQCHGETWRDVAQQLSRLGKWEFEDYTA